MQTVTPVKYKDIVIFDIDGTLANCDHRRHHLEKSPKDWEAFFAECANDRPISQVVEILRLLCPSKTVIFFTARSEHHREQTVKWLSEKLMIARNVINEKLFMRQAGDHREDSVVKSEMLAPFPLSRIWGVFDDRHSVCQMWVERGLFVFDVSQGKGHF